MKQASKRRKRLVLNLDCRVLTTSDRGAKSLPHRGLLSIFVSGKVISDSNHETEIELGSKQSFNAVFLKQELTVAMNWAHIHFSLFVRNGDGQNYYLG